MMSALTGDRMRGKFYTKSPQQTTADRRMIARHLGTTLPVSSTERRLYLEAGLEPPVD